MFWCLDSRFSFENPHKSINHCRYISPSNDARRQCQNKWLKCPKTIHFTSDKLKIVSCQHIIEFFCDIGIILMHPFLNLVFDKCSMSWFNFIRNSIFRLQNRDRQKTHRSTLGDVWCLILFACNGWIQINKWKKHVEQQNNSKNQTKTNAIHSRYWTQFIGEDRQQTWQVYCCCSRERDIRVQGKIVIRILIFWLFNDNSDVIKIVLDGVCIALSSHGEWYVIDLDISFVFLNINQLWFFSVWFFGYQSSSYE